MAPRRPAPTNDREISLERRIFLQVLATVLFFAFLGLLMALGVV